jgi:ribosome-associated toxin RatA of RatAB toxin-antitoxin module
VVDRTSSNIVIAADRHAVMDVIADLEAYPDWASGVKSVTIDEVGSDDRASQATFEVDAVGLKDTYTLAYDWQGDDRVEWHLVKGRTMKSQQGAYELEDTAGGTEVTYHLAVELNIPMLGMFKRRGEKMIIDTALKGLKKRVETDG